MKNVSFKFLLIIAVSITIGSCNRQSNSTMDTADSTNNISNTDAMTNTDQNKDQEFAKEAAMGGLMEVELGRYAQQNAQSRRVRDFGAMMVKDHSKANEELKDLAGRKGYVIPASVDDDIRQKMNDIQKKSGAEFDKEYMKEMENDHQKDVDKFKEYAEKGMDADLKQFASKTLPTLLMHLDSAKRIKEFVDRY